MDDESTAAQDVTESMIADVERCRTAPPESAQQTFRATVLQVTTLRNRELRTQSRGQRLRDLNALLSLMVSIEFPLGGFHRERLEQVLAAMRRLRSG